MLIEVSDEVKELFKQACGLLVTGFGMYCIWDLEKAALAAGVNGTQFTYTIAAISLLGGVTIAPIVEIVKKLGQKDE